jgi:zinc/manganese transport system permease protein
MRYGLALLTVHSTAARFSLNPMADLRALLHYQFMQHAFEAGTVVAIVAGVIGYFVVLRGLSFAGHALSHIGFAGATGAVVIGISPLFGLLAFTVVAAAAMGALGTRVHERDATIGIVMAWTLGMGVLFLNLYTGYATEAYALLFGEILGISIRDVQITVVAGIVTLAALVVMYRPLLFASVDADVAEARGVPVGVLSILFFIVLAFAVSEAVQVVGVLLIFALLVTPAAIAQQVTSRPAIGVAISAGLAVLFTWSGLTVAFWQPYPVSFFITSFAFAAYVLARLAPVLGPVVRRGPGHGLAASMMATATGATLSRDARRVR